MPMNANDIEKLIKAGIPDAKVTIRDLAGDGDHYAATVLAEMLSRQIAGPAAPACLQRPEGPDGRALHALALQTGLPDLRVISARA